MARSCCTRRAIYKMLATGSEYVELGQDAYERGHTARVVRTLARRAHDLGYQLVKNDPPHALARYPGGSFLSVRARRSTSHP